MTPEIYRLFYKVVNNSLNTEQINYLGESVDRSFDLYKQSGFNPNIPIPRQTAARTLLDYFSEDEDATRLFAFMLSREGKRFYQRELSIWGKDDFLALLEKYKWVYDRDMSCFLLDPFYEHEINLLKKIRVIDLREEFPIKETISEITEISKKMGIQDLEWRITIRLYDLEPKIGELIRKIIALLLAKQDLQIFTPNIFACLKELAINASKANYKLLFAKHIAGPQGLVHEKNYVQFLEKFREEIEENGNANLIELARKDDRFINIFFQSTKDAIEIWVMNNQAVSAIEKRQILSKLGMLGSKVDSFFNDDDDLVEGAGFGINLILKILRTYTREKNPLKVIFYPDSIKIGFSLKRRELLEQKPG